MEFFVTDVKGGENAVKNALKLKGGVVFCCRSYFSLIVSINDKGGDCWHMDLGYFFWLLVLSLMAIGVNSMVK